MSDRRQDNPVPPLPPRFRLTPEFRLLLASTGLALAKQTPAQAERVMAACSEGIDWEKFLSLVDRHRVLVPHDALRQLVGDRLPDRTYEQLKSRKTKACRQTLRQAAELVRLHRAFDAQGIEMIPMKGVMLSVRLFGDPAMRFTRDIDLLVRTERLDEADQILRDEGYRRTYPGSELTPKRKQWFLAHGQHFIYCHDQSRLLVELHWHLPLWKTEHIAELWSHCQAKTWMGTSFLNLKDDALLLYLCDHGAWHRWSRSKWLEDIAVLLAQEQGFAWENVLALARRFDLSLALAQAGLLVHWLYGIPLPEPLVALIATEKRSVSLAAKAVDAMLLSEEEQFALPARIKYRIYLLHIRERLPGHVALSSSMVSTDVFKECPLPDGLFWLYLPLRPLLWFYHHCVERKTES